MRTSLKPRILPEYVGFWEGCRVGELRVQRCIACGVLRFPPQPLCHACQSNDREWVAVDGLGTVYTYSINTGQGIAGAILPGENGFPYAVAVIELDCGVRMISDFDTEDLDRLSIGSRVRAIFEDFGEGLIGPNFALIDG